MNENFGANLATFLREYRAALRERGHDVPEPPDQPIEAVWPPHLWGCPERLVDELPDLP